MVICNCVGNCDRAEDCPHSTPHDQGNCYTLERDTTTLEEVMVEIKCTSEGLCPTTGYVVKCIEVEEN